VAQTTPDLHVCHDVGTAACHAWVEKWSVKVNLKTAATKDAANVTLFDESAVARHEQRISAFAREVAKRHRGHADAKAFVRALRGYYAMWSLFERLPALDDGALAHAVAEYRASHGGGERVAA